MYCRGEGDAHAIPVLFATSIRKLYCSIRPRVFTWCSWVNLGDESVYMAMIMGAGRLVLRRAAHGYFHLP